MYSVTDRFLEAISRSGKRKTVVDLYYGSALIESDVAIIDGSISVDRNSRSRRTGSITLKDPTLFPRVWKSTALSPYGVELRVRTGIVYPNKLEELVPMGVFLINSVSGSVQGGMVPAVSFTDRAQRVYETGSWAVNESGFNFGGKTVQEAITDLVQYASPGWPGTLWNIEFQDVLVDRVINGTQYNGSTDRWQLIDDLAKTIGAEVYFDVNGDCQVVASPALFQANSESDAVWTANKLISADVSITRDNTYNSVMVTGSAPDGVADAPQPFAIVYDSDVRSKTVWNGHFGKKTYRKDAGWLTTNEECQYMAKTLLRLYLGLSETISFEHIQNPALDVSDIIIVPIDGVNNLLMVDKIDFPLNTGTMSVSTRTTQFAS